MKKLGLFCFAFLFGCSVSNAGSTSGFTVECNKLNKLINITAKSRMFERVLGEYEIENETISLLKHGFDVLVPVPINYKFEMSDFSGTEFKFSPKEASSTIEESSDIQILPYEIKYKARNYLKKILNSSEYENYKSISMFDFLVKSLGKGGFEFRCDKVKNSVAMFMSSYIRPLSNDGVFVYYVANPKSLVFISKNDQLGLIQIIYPKGKDSLVYVNVEGSPKLLNQYIKIQTHKGDGGNKN